MPHSATDSTRLLLATRSEDKAREIREILQSPGIRIVSLADVAIAPSPAEDGLEIHSSFLRNAEAKALYFNRLSGLPVLADDSGLCVDALDGRPGVHSKRFSGRSDLSGGELDEANNRTLLEALDSAGGDRRGARYVCAAVMVVETGTPLVAAIGTVRGTLLREPRGSGGFGYDPLFMLPATGLTFAQVDRRTKHANSHRGRAFRALANVLRR